MTGGVRTERQGASYVVTLDRAERRNAIDGPTADALARAYDEFEADERARVLVVTGANGTFCAGADLKAIDTLAPRVDGPDGPLGFTRRLPSKPTIAAVDGWAVAGGLELALWCDLRFASPAAKFGCLERRWGVPLIDGGTWRLPRIVGLGRALDLVLTGRVVDADEALAMGLVNRVVDDPLAHALELAETLAGFPQETMLADRVSVYDGLHRDLADGLAAEAARGIPTVLVGREGAQRFAAGEGRGGVSTG